ncbi:hypothetical protein HDV63DRAFT_154122 [Trichoderma sp. SZMC 28014]
MKRRASRPFAKGIAALMGWQKLNVYGACLCATPCLQVSKTSWLGSLAYPAQLTQAPHYRLSAQPVSLSIKHRSNRSFQQSEAKSQGMEKIRKEPY